MPLTLSRREGDSIFIGADIEIRFVRIGAEVARVSIIAPDDVPIVRHELIQPGQSLADVILAEAEPRPQSRMRPPPKPLPPAELKPITPAIPPRPAVLAKWNEIAALHAEDPHCRRCGKEVQAVFVRHRTHREDLAVLALPGVLSCPDCAAVLRHEARLAEVPPPPPVEPEPTPAKPEFAPLAVFSKFRDRPARTFPPVRQQADSSPAETREEAYA